ncbi:hypothetical protein ACFQHV_01430 [Promicromonospora thailandica]|uniref:Secreted protein n=1 Tax=Promicromonospora thailandica TaxID=765201 RepID=A0A9X2JVD3_9MICO|nr:hypothetical protein [Promicromonospora thailandica]MCP2265485.1 hypothetical protein [Promicromonospora thailandica]BFF17038.1 hypothetical protein GCM10025730_05590 [Promicromonospora thailandica]
MIRRLFWVGVGVAVTVVVVRKGRQVIERYTPAAVSERAAAAVDDAGARLNTAARTFRAEFAEARAEREAELMASLRGELPGQGR